MRRAATLGSVGLLLVILAACNPLTTNPVSMGDLDLTSAHYDGPSPAWADLSVRGAPDHIVFAFALITNADLTGPTDRSCTGPTSAVVPCTVTTGDVRMPNQRVVPGDGSAKVRLMTIWPGERVQIALVCVDNATQELACPTTVRTAIGAVTDDGTRVGDLAA
jgi:hypothetical protein